jgi:lysophospholipase L1-like esterase
MPWPTPSRRLRHALTALVLAMPATLATAQEPKKNAPPESATDPSARGGDGWWMKAHEGFLERLKPGTTELIFIGDSITQGWGGGGKPVWDRHYGPRQAVNLGIGGDRTQHVLWRLDHGELDGIKPKVAVVMIGTNNISSNSPDEIASGVTAIVKKVRDKLPATKVLLLGVFPRSAKPDATRDRVRAVNDKIKPLDDGQSVKYLDISGVFLNPDGTISKEIMPDYLHLSPKGYRLWADAIEPTLWTMMEGK